MKHSINNFIFESPDVCLDAYRTKNNGLLTAEQFSGFRWVSLDKLEIVNINSQSLFEFQTLSFWFQFEMLTNRDRGVLAD